MKLSCKVIEDMLPMYYDGVCSEESAVLVEEHLEECPHCTHILAQLRSEIATPKKNVDDMKPLKRIQKSYKKMKTHWLIAVAVILLLIPVAFWVGTERSEESKPPVDFTQEEALAYANGFMDCLVDGDYAEAYTHWDIAREIEDLCSSGEFTEEDMANFEADGLEKFCAGGEILETMGGFESYEVEQISDAGYFNCYGTEDYFVIYTVIFNGKTESMGVSLTKHGIDSLSSGDGLIRHPLSHLTLWVQWVVDDYMGRYYDFDLGDWVEKPKVSE